MSEKVLFIDTNLGLEHALRFGRDGYETFYAVVYWDMSGSRLVEGVECGGGSTWFGSS